VVHNVVREGKRKKLERDWGNDERGGANHIRFVGVEKMVRGGAAHNPNIYNIFFSQSMTLGS